MIILWLLFVCLTFANRKGTTKNAYVQTKREFLNKKDRFIYLIYNYAPIRTYFHVIRWSEAYPERLEPLKQRSGETSPQGMKPFHL